MMKPSTESETASNDHETGRKCQESSGALGKFTTFAVGLGIGAVVGLLFAPASGKKTRHYIARSTKQGLDAATSEGKRWSRRAQETADDVKANVAGVVEAGQKAYRTARDA
jgi:gas vesicle protein